MDAKLAAYAARKFVEVICNDPDVAPDLKRILTQLMGADLKTLENRKVDVATGAAVLLDSFAAEDSCDLVTVVVASGARLYLLVA